jgi:RHS repeat-associated protein
MSRRRWVARVSMLVLFSMLFDLVGGPLALDHLVQATTRELRQIEDTSQGAQALMDFLSEVDRAIAPTAYAHDPGDTSSLGACDDQGDPCKDGESGGSEVQYSNRALTMSEVLGSAGVPLILGYNSRYEMTPMALAAWVPTTQAIDDWQLQIAGWTFEGTGAHPFALWDTTDRTTGQPVPEGLYYYEVSYGNSLGRGSTSHPVLVKRAAGEPVGANWSHSYQCEVLQVDEETLILKTLGVWMLFTHKSRGVYTSPAAGDSTITAQPDGTWQWKRTGGDGSPVTGVVTFDAQGRAVRFVDRVGNPIDLRYDGERLVSLVDAVGRETRLAYSGGHVAAVTDAAGQEWTLGYEGDDLVEIANPLGHRVRLAYDGAHRLVQRTDPRGSTTDYAYDADGGVTEIADAAGNRMAFETTYRAGPMLDEDPSRATPILGTTTVTALAADGRQTGRKTYDFDDQGRIVRVVESPDGGETRYVWQYNWDRAGGSGQLLSTVDPQGNETTFSYRGGTTLVTEIESPGQAALRFAYEQTEGGWVMTRIATGSESATELDYDEQGRLVRVTRGKLGYWLQYDEGETALRGLPTAMVWNWDGKGDPYADGQALVMRYQYDARCRLARTTDPLGRETAFAYDGADRLARLTDALGRTTTYEYDAVGRLVRQVDAAGGETRYAYDEGGNLTRLVDARGNETTFGYDHKGRLIWKQDPLGRTLRYGYDDRGNLVWREDGRGALVRYTHDQLGRMTAVSFPSGESWQIAYDALGRATLAMAGDRAWSFAYDGEGRLVRASDNRPGRTSAVSYEYDPEGRVTGSETLSGFRVAYAYDPYGEVSSIRGAHIAVKLKYETKGQLAPRLSEVERGGLTTQMTYDAVGRLSEIEHLHQSWAPGDAITYRYTYDAADNVASIEGPSRTTSYAYDALDQLVGVNGPGGETVSYAYDAAGNRARQQTPAGVVEYTYDAANQLLTAGTQQFAYDANGHLVEARDGARARTYAWDYQGRLRAVSERAGDALPFPLSAVGGDSGEDRVLARYTYDLFGRAVRRSDAGAKVDALADGAHVASETDAEGHELARYVFGPGWDELLFQDAGDESERLYPFGDQVGTVTGAATSKGDVLYGASYDPWGAPLQRAADSPLPGFQGRPYDAATGLYSFRARFYDPELGRFISPDPIQPAGMPRTLNGYAFALSNPLRFRDPTGQIVPLIIAAAIIGAAYGASYYGASYGFSTPSDCRTWGGWAKNIGLGAAIGGAVGALGAGVGVVAPAALGITSTSSLVMWGMLGGTASGATESVLSQLLIDGTSWGDLDKTDVILAAGAGALGGAAAGFVSPITGEVLGTTISTETWRELLGWIVIDGVVSGVGGWVIGEIMDSYRDAPTGMQP